MFDEKNFARELISDEKLDEVVGGRILAGVSMNELAAKFNRLLDGTQESSPISRANPTTAVHNISATKI